MLRRERRYNSHSSRVIRLGCGGLEVCLITMLGAIMKIKGSTGQVESRTTTPAPGEIRDLNISAKVNPSP